MPITFAYGTDIAVAKIMPSQMAWKLQCKMYATTKAYVYQNEIKEILCGI